MTAWYCPRSVALTGLTMSWSEDCRGSWGLMCSDEETRTGLRNGPPLSSGPSEDGDTTSSSWTTYNEWLRNQWEGDEFGEKGERELRRREREHTLCGTACTFIWSDTYTSCGCGSIFRSSLMLRGNKSISVYVETLKAFSSDSSLLSVLDYFGKCFQPAQLHHEYRELLEVSPARLLRYSYSMQTPPASTAALCFLALRGSRHSPRLLSTRGCRRMGGSGSYLWLRIWEWSSPFLAGALGLRRHRDRRASLGSPVWYLGYNYWTLSTERPSL